MDGEFDRTNHVVAIVVVKVVEVVNVIDSDLVVLALLEMICNFEVLNPFRGQVVHDDLRLAQLFPKISTEQKQRLDSANAQV